MNTGLGSNVNYKLNKKEIENFQQLIIEGRSSSVGKFLDEEIGLLLFMHVVSNYQKEIQVYHLNF